MGEGGLTWETCWPVVEAEARAWRSTGEQLGLDHDDLTQEAALAAVQCLQRFRPEAGGAHAYVRQAIRNRLANLRKEALRQRRTPHDMDGRPQPSWVVGYEDETFLRISSGFDKGRDESRQALRILHEQLPPTDWEFLVRTLIQGAHLARGHAPKRRQQLNVRLHEIRQRARRILNGILQTNEDQSMNAAIPKPIPEELPECHAEGAQPQGYDYEDRTCQNCRDKFTCFPAALDKQLVAGQLSDDCEIHAVLNEDMSFRTAVERMKTRIRIFEAGGDAPADLDTRRPIVQTGIRPIPQPVSTPPPPPKPAPEPEPEPESERPIRMTEEQAKEAVTAMRTGAVKARARRKPPAKKKKPAAKAKPAKKKTLKRPTKKKPARTKTRTKTTKARAKDPLVTREGFPTMKNGKPLPPVRQLTKKQMQGALRRISIDAPFVLELGMQLVRKTKDGDHVIVQLVPTGFQLDGVIYSSLSTAVMYRLRKQTSGNDYFNLVTRQCTEVWSEDGDVLAGYSTA